jgi:hypothetical protein
VIQSAWTASTGYQTGCCRCNSAAVMLSCATACIGLGWTLHYHGSAYNAKQNDILAVSRVGHCCRMAAQTAGCAAKHALCALRIPARGGTHAVDDLGLSVH